MWGRVMSLVEHVYVGSCCTLFSFLCCDDMSNTTGVTSGACLCGSCCVTSGACLCGSCCVTSGACLCGVVLHTI